MLERALGELRAAQPVFSVAAARRVASVLADVDPDALAQTLLEHSGVPARAVLGDAACAALRDGRYGSPARADELMRSLARRARGAAGTALRSPELLARLAVCALVGAARDTCTAAEDGDNNNNNNNWLAALARDDGDGRFWRCFAGSSGRGALLAALQAQQAQGSALGPGARGVWARLWDTVRRVFAGRPGAEAAAVALAVGAAVLLGEGVAARAAEDVATLVRAHVRSVGAGEDTVVETARVLLESAAVLRGQERAFVDAALALLCRCVEADCLSPVHDVVAALQRAVGNGGVTAAQQHELTVLCAFLLATTGGALGEDLVPALEQNITGVSCTYVRALVQCSLISFLYTAEKDSHTRKLAEKLLNTLEKQSTQEGGKGCSCQSQSGQNNTKPAGDAPLGLALTSFARHLCTATHYSHAKYSEWTRTLSKKLETLNTCRPMLLFLLSPLLLPQYSQETLDQNIPLFQKLASKHPEECFTLFPHVLNLLVSDTLLPNRLSHLTNHPPPFFFFCV